MAGEDSALETRREAEASPQKAYRHWMLELKLADKREKTWREQAHKTLDVYRGKEQKANSFNILWANTEVLRPALYNSPPKPDVRRRFRQNDALGKAVAEVAERSLSYCIDAYDLDDCLQADVLDALLPGRAVSRVRYVPKIKTVPERRPELPAGGAKPPLLPEPTEARNNSAKQPAGAEGAEAPHAEEAFEGTREEVEYEQALCEHVQWEDYRQGPGRRWDEVPWVAFRHRLRRDDLIEQFGAEIGKKITLNDVTEDELKEKGVNDELRDTFKRAEVWEIWDKDSQRVFFVNESYREGLIYPVKGVAGKPRGEPPLKLKNFFPIPRPMQLVEDSGNLVPIPLYEFYRQQAKELDRLATRINKIIEACRVRFVHDPTLSELAELMKAGDNEGIPAENARAWMANGGIEKAIWWMPIQNVAAVLRELYVARDNAKQTIYEITGISDIIRGATNPNETLGAQQLKANSSSLRLQRMKAEVQRYARDLIRLLAEVIGENFEPQTLAQMTGLQFPTARGKQIVQLRIQAIQAKAQAAGAQPPPELMAQIQQAQQALAMPSWEDIMAVLRSDMQREFRVDIETDSTVAQTLQQDMEGLREVLTGIVEFWQGVGPAVQAGAVKMEAVKAITMSIVRRARMGLEVEDALEAGMQEPKPQDNGETAKQAAEAQKEQAAQQAEATKAQAQAQENAAKAQADAQVQTAKEQEITRRQQIEAENKLAIRQAELDKQYAFERWKVQEDNRTKIEVAEISAGAALDAAEIKGANAGVEGDPAAAPEGAQPAGQAAKRPKRKTAVDKLAEMHGATMEQHGKLVEAVHHLASVAAAPRKSVPVRDAQGRTTHMISTPDFGTAQ